MQLTLLDTDHLSELMAGRNRRLLEVARQYYRVHRSFLVSAISIAEIEAGIWSSRRDSLVQAFEAVQPTLEIVPFEAEEAFTSGRIIGHLKINGQPIGPMDPLIAATAIERDLILATGNTRHYQRIVDAGFALKLVDWNEELGDATQTAVS
ncbi:MAG TPA: PIN domain-containing protein [Fimbriimonas sp.]|nr:PIN domain-containing protein [Fimbriimonas sp.]